jgi:hypothetical protein
MMNGREKSDPAVVAVKSTNEAGQPGEEWMEPYTRPWPVLCACHQACPYWIQTDIANRRHECASSMATEAKRLWNR